VRAQKDSFTYRAEKFVKRNKFAVGTISLILLSLVGGLAAALWLADAARQERNRAERRFNDVRQLSNALLNDIAPKIERLEGSTEARQSLVVQSLKYLDSLAGESADDLTLQAELAAAYEKVGTLQGDSRNLLLNAHWNYTPSARLFTQTRVFGLRTDFTNTNRDESILDDGQRTQFGVRHDINYLARPSHRIEAGLYVRSIRAERFDERFDFFQPERDVLTFSERATEQGYYVQDTYTNERLGLSLTGGGRIEHSGLTGETLLSPRAALGLAPGSNWRIRAAFGRYYQFPDFEETFGRLGSPNLRAERATHYNASVERTLGSRTRVLVEVYDREDANLLFSLSEPRVEAEQITFTEFQFRNALRGHARGIELTLQRRSANNLTGWISYSYSKTRLRDEQSHLSFISDFDQRHGVNAYASYRFTETFNLSGQWRYGSGLPIPGFLQRIGPDLFLASERNLVRVPAYNRIDVRANKAFLFKKWKLTLSGEVLNVLNRENLRYAGFDGYGSRGRVFGNLDKLLPILPSAGVAIEF